MTSSVVEYIFQTLQAQLDEHSAAIDRLTTLTERSETAGGMASCLLADAPNAAIGGVSSGDMLFISNGRKAGEGVGAGTGVPCYYNTLTDSWLRFSDDTAVLT